MRLVGTVVCLTFVLCAGGATADTSTVEDARDFSGPLDIVSASHGHDHPTPTGAVRLRHKIVSKQRWELKDIRCRQTRCKGILTIRFDLDGDSRYERSLYIFSVRRDLRAEMFRHGQSYDCQAPRILCGNNRFVRQLSVWRTDAFGVATRFPARMLRPHITAYGWRAEAQTGLVSRCRGDVGRNLQGWMICTDLAPQGRYEQHRL